MNKERTSPVQADAITDVRFKNKHLTVQADASLNLKLAVRASKAWQEAVNCVKLHLDEALLTTGRKHLMNGVIFYGDYTKESSFGLPYVFSKQISEEIDNGYAFIVNSTLLPSCQNDKTTLDIILAFVGSRPTKSEAVYYPANKVNKKASIIVFVRFGVKAPSPTNVNHQNAFKVTLDNLAKNTHYISRFEHEFTHYFDDVASKKGILDRKKRKFDTSTDGGYKGYINSVVEVNARYIQTVGNIYRLYKQYRSQNTTIGQMLPTFDDFFTLVWHREYTPYELIENATPATKRRLIKRLYALYNFFKAAEQPTKLDVAKLVQKQLKAT